jgi:hypothetical protein
MMMLLLDDELGYTLLLLLDDPDCFGVPDDGEDDEALLLEE